MQWNVFEVKSPALNEQIQAIKMQFTSGAMVQHLSYTHTPTQNMTCSMIKPTNNSYHKMPSRITRKQIQLRERERENNANNRHNQLEEHSTACDRNNKRVCGRNAFKTKQETLGE